MFEGDSSDPWGNGTTVNRQSNDTRYSMHDLEAYYLAPFKAAMVDAGAGSVMYVRVQQNTLSHRLLVTVTTWMSMRATSPRNGVRVAYSPSLPPLGCR